MEFMWGFRPRRHPMIRFDHQPRTVVPMVRIWPFAGFIICFCLILGVRLLQLTIVEGAWRRKTADDNRTFTLRLAPQRGILFDRDGVPLTQNLPIYKHRKPGTSPAELQYERIEREKALSLLTNPDESVWFDMDRTYPCGRACAAVVGYLAEMSATNLFEQVDYQLGDMVGKVGAEKEYERSLRGSSGEEHIEVNARGVALRTVGVKPAKTGIDLSLSIDSRLSQIIYEAYGDKIGGAVALDPKTGEILAAVSVPSFDPANLGNALKEPNQPFFNRAIGGTYAPGSTFKMVTAMAALEEGKIEQNTQFQDTGELVVGSYRYGNWLYDEHGRTEGSVDVVKALGRSNDIFFYHAGELVGADKLAEWANLLGMGKAWNLGSWGEATAFIPTPKWKLEKKGERWYLGNTYHMAIGQGDVLASPLSIAVMTSALANNGKLCPPNFVKSKESPNCQQLNLDTNTLQVIKQGMETACRPGGTGTPFFQFEPRVACKTGTAQQGGEEDLPHGWFTAFAPIDNPSIVVTVLVEKGGQGSEVAAPIAKQAIQYWLNK